MKFNVLTLFPEMIEVFKNTSIISRAVADDKVDISITNIRDFSKNKHNSVDDMPYGGGAGMVMTPQPLDDSITHVKSKESHVVFLSPKGTPLTQKKVNELSEKKDLVLVCGHYEGIDQRIIDQHIDEQISIGDYVLTGGELPAMVVMDAVIRVLPGVIGSEDSFKNDSHYNGLLDYPHYTRPSEYKRKKVPNVLLSGHHKKINEWREEQMILQTLEYRPDLIEKFLKTSDDEKVKEKIRKIVEKN